MAIQIQGNTGIIQEVDGTLFRAARITGRPLDVGSLGHYRLGMSTGVIGAGLAANGELFQFRWTDATRLAIIQKVLISAGANGAATAAAFPSLELTVARAWTAAGTGGVVATLGGNNQKTRTSMGSTLLGEARVATTAALGAGTKTLDTNSSGNVIVPIGTGAITVGVKLGLVDKIDMLEVDADTTQHPIVLAQNEGFVIKNGAIAFPATMTWGLAITVIWAEVTAY